MSHPLDFQRQMRSAQTRLQELKQRATGSNSNQDALLAEVFAELSISLEELHVAAEELHDRNNELLASRQEVIQERHRYQNLFNLAPDAYLITNQLGIIQLANDAAQGLLNVRRDLLVDKPLILFMAESDHSLIFAQLNRIPDLAEPQSKGTHSFTQRTSRPSNPQLTNILLQDQEVTLHPRDLETVPVSLALSAEYDAQNEWLLCWSFRDLRVRKQAEEKILEQRALIDIATDAMFVRNVDGQIKFWSQGAERMYGWTSAEVLEGIDSKFLGGETDSTLGTALKISQEQGFWEGELPQITKAGNEILVASRWTFVQETSEHPESILVVNTDITEKKRLEAQFHQAQRLESVGMLASGIAHDLNNILTPILAIAQLLRHQGQVDKTAFELLTLLEESAIWGANMVKQILNFTQGNEGEFTSVNLVPFLEDVLNVFRQSCPPSIEIRQDFSNLSHSDLSGCSVFADLTHLHQVFMNLCINALDAMPNGGLLTVSCDTIVVDEDLATLNQDAEVGAYWVVTVADTGTGITPDVRDRMFEPFFTTKEYGKGTGLGLSTVLGIIKTHGGFLQVLNNAGPGTQMKVYLPVCEEKPTPSLSPQTLSKGHGELILIVEDDITVQKTTKKLLESYSYQTLVAKDGMEAIQLYTQRQDEISLVILDIMMPNLRGTTVIQRLKQLNSTVKIITVSGVPMNRESVLAAGADDFLPKPYSVDKLLNKINELIHKSPALSP